MNQFTIYTGWSFLRNYRVLLLLSLLCFSTSYGHPTGDTINNGNRNYISGSYQVGKVLSTNPFVNGENRAGRPISYSQSFSLEFGKQTIGDKAWQQVYGYPRFGIGICIIDFSYARETGVPVTLYGYFNGPFKRWKRTSLNFEIGMGLTSNWRRYKLDNNPWNVAIGSAITAYVDLGTDFTLFLSNRLDLDIGLHFIHCSNGAVTLPNAGINQYALRMAMRYNFSGQRPVFIRHEFGKFQKNWEWLAHIGWGPKQLNFDTLPGGYPDYTRRVNFSVVVLGSELLYQVSNKVKFGVGLDVTFNEANYIQIERQGGKAVKQPVPVNRNIMLSSFGCVELVINRLSVAVKPGIYLVRTTTPWSAPVFYQQLGIKYHLFRSKNLFVGISLRAYYFRVADFIEWNLGYRIKWK